METLFQFCEQNLQLYPHELLMIPVVGFLFCLFWILMTKLLFRPYLNLIEAREELTVRAVERTDQANSLAEEITTEFEAEISRTRKEAIKNKNAVVSEAQKQAAVISEKADAEAEAKLRHQRRDIAERTQEIKEEIIGDLDQLAGAVVDKLKIAGNASL